MKSSLLPAYCDPPNPCPLGYTAQVRTCPVFIHLVLLTILLLLQLSFLFLLLLLIQDGCIEDFENNSEFSQKYQASQRCMCDTEHMFSCPDTMAKQEQQLSFMEIPEELANPFLSGAKLPIAAKKGF